MKFLSKALGCCPLLVVISLFSPTLAIAGDGMQNTAHDFIEHPDTLLPTQIGLCTFCHTPHRAGGTANPTQKLLWNHRVSTTNTSYSWAAGTATTGGTPYPTIANDYPGPTSKCLSCHDGSVAIGDVYWFQAAQQNLNGFQITGSRQIGGGGVMTGNHPVAMPYPYGGVVNTYNGQTNGTTVPASGWVADPAVHGIRLFHDTGGDIVAGASGTITGIECTSCHDPHNKDASVPSGALYFLRGTISGKTAADDYICAKCHDKG